MSVEFEGIGRVLAAIDEVGDTGDIKRALGRACLNNGASSA